MTQEPGLHFLNEQLISQGRPGIPLDIPCPEIPAYLLAVMEQMRADLRSFGIDVEMEVITYGEWLRISGGLPVRDVDGAAMSALHLRVDDSLGSPLQPTMIERTILQAVEQVQDFVTGYLHETWPPCPGHQHPAKPAKSVEDFAWVCPKNGVVIAPLGRFPAPNDD